MLIQVIAPVGKGSLRSIFELIARLKLFAINMAIGTKRGFMTIGADLFLLHSVKLVSSVKIGAMVQGCFFISVAFAADRLHIHTHRVPSGDTRILGTGKKSGSYCQDGYDPQKFDPRMFHPLLSSLYSGKGAELVDKFYKCPEFFIEIRIVGVFEISGEPCFFG